MSSAKPAGEPASEFANFPPHLRKRMLELASAAPQETSVEDALSLGRLRLADLADPEEAGGVWNRHGAATLLPEASPGRRDGTVETNLVRKGLFVTGRKNTGNSEQLMLRVIATRDRLGEIRRVDTDGPALTEVEFQVACVLCTAWRAMDNAFAIAIPMTLGAVCREIGWANSGARIHRVAEALSALKRATFAGEVWDVTSNEKRYLHEFGLVQEWSAGKPNRPGQFGEIGFVMISDWLRRQLHGQHETYYSRELMRSLRRPSAKMLLPYLESERFELTTPDGTKAKEWPVTEELFATVGIADSRVRQARRTLAKAGEEIVEADGGRRWVRIEVQPVGRGYRLIAERRS